MGWSEETRTEYTRVTREAGECDWCEVVTTVSRYTFGETRTTKGGFYGGAEVGYQEYEVGYDRDSHSVTYCHECEAHAETVGEARVYPSVVGWA